APVDLRILETLRDRGLDVIAGGHEHERLQLPAGAPRIFKADADAASAWVITLRLDAERRLHVSGTLRELTETIAPDPAVAERVTQWLQRHEREYCARTKRQPGCLGERLGTTKTVIVAEEERIRAGETSLGNWITDAMRETFEICGAGGA